ncbi:MAG: acetyl-CoA carboxylase biotin carboxylase subunit [Puniceicoccales bacterium]|jgi:acetyl-CoA carboxylase biotin carboxylase subunit|nr:acetyl-CoA carboxylase biotin carboxylase subunit [Puniceicoccales bacterium]
MMKKLLIANRGEIALRIIRACKEMGIETLAVYSQADRSSLHVSMADEAICIGPAPASESYLRMDRIMSAAELANVDAIHPGYGFLSENANFVQLCEDCHIRFVGPSSATIRQMGDKACAKEIAKKAGIPTIPGSPGILSDETEALAMAETISYPILLKAVAGGGGKGMRLVAHKEELAKEFLIARSEAEKNFGHGAIYMEKYIEEPRHVEIQILADGHGHYIHLGERDCSIQRRYQKLIEESPSPFLDDTLRQSMGEAAVHIAQACHYENAGTIEFLVDKHGKFYFMEMNTRIQVEHGVTEEATGIDLLKLQLLVAMGEHLPIRQSDIHFTGHALECRINAENPDKNFAPSPGTISFYHAPGGRGVRVDSHIYNTYTIPPYYDSMVAKIITQGATRLEAIRCMERALAEVRIEGKGIFTTTPFLQKVMRDEAFQKGDITTHFLEDFLKRSSGS